MVKVHLHNIYWYTGIRVCEPVSGCDHIHVRAQHYIQWAKKKLKSLSWRGIHVNKVKLSKGYDK